MMELLLLSSNNNFRHHQHSYKNQNQTNSTSTNTNSNNIHYDNGIINPLRLLVEGPNQCGKTSLLMDVAYSIASKQYHYQQQQHSNQKHSNQYSVTFLIPAKKRSNTFFPLHCTSSSACDSHNGCVCHSRQRNESSNGSSSKKRKYNECYSQQCVCKASHENENENESNNYSKRKNHQSQFSKEILNHIKIKYVHSVYELMQYLASRHTHDDSDGDDDDTCSEHENSTISNQQQEEQQEQQPPPPCNIILIDDLDYYIRECNHYKNHNQNKHSNKNKDKDSISKSLFGEDATDDDYESTNQKENGNTKNRETQPQPLSTIETMRLIQLLAHMSDTCNNINHGNTAFVSSMNTDRLPLSKQTSILLHHYASMIATIQPATMNHYRLLEQQQQQQSPPSSLSSFRKKDKLASLFDSSSSSSLSKITPSQVISMWKMNLQYDSWKEMSIYKHQNQNHDDEDYNNTQMKTDLSTLSVDETCYSLNIFYVIHWMYDPIVDENENDDDDGVFCTLDTDDHDEGNDENDEIDYDGKEITWKLF